MTNPRGPFSYAGLLAGSLATLIAIVHFWAGPIVEPPPLEEVISDKIVATRDATVAKLLGRPAPVRPEPDRWGPDRLVQAGGATLGGLAIVLAAVGFSRRESRRQSLAALGLGVTGVLFPLLGAVIVIVAVVAILGSLGFS